MGVIFNQGYDRTKRIRLPEGETTLDPRDPVQAAGIGAIVRNVRNATSLEDTGAVLSLIGAVKVVDPQASKAKTVVGRTEVYHMNDGKQTMTVNDPIAMGNLLTAGWKCIKTETKDILG